MNDSYKNICKSLKAGGWYANFVTRTIKMDKNLLELLEIPAQKLTFNEFYAYVSADEKEAIVQALESYTSTQLFNCLINLKIDDKFYLVEAVLDSPSFSEGKLIQGSGYMRLNSVHSTASENVHQFALEELVPNLSQRKNLETFYQEQNRRIGLACKVGLIYPWTWYVMDNSLEFLIFDDVKISKQVSSLADFASSIYPTDRTAFYLEIGKVALNKSQSLHLKYRSSNFNNDASSWYEMIGEAFEFDDYGKCTKVVGVVYDITDREQRAKMMAENEKMLIAEKNKAEKAVTDRRIVLDNLNAGLVYMDKNYVVQWESLNVVAGCLGEGAYRPGEFCYNSVYGRTEPCTDCPIHRMFLSLKQEKHSIERKGEILEITANPVFDNGNDVQGIVLKIENITEQVKQANEITRLNTLMDAILNNIPVYLFVKDPNNDFRYSYWNKAMADNTKIPTEQVLGRRDEDVFPNEEDVARMRKNDAMLLNSRKTLNVIEEYNTLDGEKRIASSVKTLIPSANQELPLILGISWDITDLKRAEQELIVAKDKAEESNRLKSAFLANMSHEIRTPLNAIVGFSDLLVEAESKDERRSYMEFIQKNNELLLQLISDILDLSKIEAQSMEFVLEVTDMNKLCAAVVAAGNLRTDAKVPVVFENSIPDCFVRTDKNRINQVLSNLVNNALKFTTTGDVRVGYHIVGDMIRFYVQDTGIGIKPEQLNSVFERFVKLDHFAQGTGLGLPICKNIVEQLRGHIGVESEWGKGTCFWFTLPYDKNLKGIEEAAPKMPDFLKTTRPGKIKPGIGRKLCILIAEDIESNFQLINDAFKGKHRLIRAVNGVEAVEKYKEYVPDLILMDIKMPEMDGLEATKQIRRLDPLVPIIAVTAYAYESDAQKASAAGCNSFLTKPLSINDLERTIGQFVG